MRKLIILIVLLFATSSQAQYMHVAYNNLHSPSNIGTVIKGVCTDPYHHSWLTWWSLGTGDFQIEIASRVSLWDSLNVNLVRTMVDTAGVKATTFMTNFAYLKNQCRIKGIYLGVVLFAWAIPPGEHCAPADTSKTGRLETLYNTLVATYKTDTTIAWWEIRNESFSNISALGYPEAECDSLIRWHIELYNWVAANDTNHIIIHSSNPYQIFRAFEENSKGYTIHQISDFSAIEWYVEPTLWGDVAQGSITNTHWATWQATGFVDYLEFLRTPAGIDMLGKPIIVTEMGRSVDRSGGSAYDQYMYLSMMGKKFNSRELQGTIIWADKDSYQDGEAYMFGLADSSGTMRLSGRWYKNWELGNEKYDIWK